MVRGIKYLLGVGDMDRARRFYVSTFGLEVVVSSEHWTELRLGSASIGLHGGRSSDEQIHTGVSFTVDDLDATAAAVTEHGGRVVTAPYEPPGEGIRLAELLDTEGNVFMASQDLVIAPERGGRPIVTVFRSRLRAEAAAEYAGVADRMAELAESMPGFVERKTFVADDGERVTVAVFDSAAAQAGWRNHPEHREAQRMGRARFYDDYRIQVCELVDDRRFVRADDARDGHDAHDGGDVAARNDRS